MKLPIETGKRGETMSLPTVEDYLKETCKEDSEITLNMCESYVTYTNKGKVKIDVNYFPQLKNKTKEEIAEWVTINSDSLYIDCYTGWLYPSLLVTKEEFIINYGFSDLSGKELEDALDEEGWDGEYESETDRIPLREYFQNASVEFDKIKNEEHYFVAD